MMQEKNDKILQKCFHPEMHAGRADTTASADPPLPAARYPEIDVGFRPRIGTSSCPDTGRDHSPATDRGTLRGRRRLLCPHLLGWNRHRRLQVLCYQYGGDSESGLKPADAADNWRCLAVENLSQVELLDGPWQTAENRSRPQNCIEEIELDVDACPELVPPIQSTNPKSAKL